MTVYGSMSGKASRVEARGPCNYFAQDFIKQHPHVAARVAGSETNTRARHGITNQFKDCPYLPFVRRDGG